MSSLLIRLLFFVCFVSFILMINKFAQKKNSILGLGQVSLVFGLGLLMLVPSHPICLLFVSHLKFRLVSNQCPEEFSSLHKKLLKGLMQR